MNNKHDMNYFQHLWKNWKVSAHALKDAFAHFIHGLFPFIKIEHHQPVPEVKEGWESAIVAKCDNLDVEEIRRIWNSSGNKFVLYKEDEHGC